MINVTDIKNGMTILFEDNIYTVLEFSHVKPGKGAAFVQAKLKNLRTGSIVEKRFNSGVKLDKAMVEMGIPGKTMGERLKKSGSRFSDIDKVWKAHKLRNALAHETDLEITYKQAATAVLIYEQALKDLGAI